MLLPMLMFCVGCGAQELEMRHGMTLGNDVEQVYVILDDDEGQEMWVTVLEDQMQVMEVEDQRELYEGSAKGFSY